MSRRDENVSLRHGSAETLAEQSLMDGGPELQHVAIVVIDRELAHTVLEVLHWVGDLHLVLQLDPERRHVVHVEVEGPGEARCLEWDMGVRHRDHHAYGVAAE